MQRRTFLQGLMALAVAMRMPLRPAQSVPAVALGENDYGWFEMGMKDGVAYQALGIGGTVHVLYVTADGQAHSKITTSGNVGLGDATPNRLLHVTEIENWSMR